MGGEESTPRKILIDEGSAKIYFDDGITQDEVFYNPVQQFNRDLTCLVLQAYNKQVGKKTTLFEAFSATGLRSIRYAKEVQGFEKIIANDIDPTAVKVISDNIVQNGVQDLVVASKGDANRVLLDHKKDLDIIDLDPYSTVSLYLDSAIQAVKHGGLLCVTSTDGRTLCGQQQEKSYAWYGTMIIGQTPFHHEFGIRVLLTLIRQIAARYKRSVEPVLSLAVNFYMRVFVRIYDHGDSTRISKDTSLCFYSPVTHSFWLQPIGRVMKDGEVKPNLVSVPFKDPLTNTDLVIGGPVYTGPLHNRSTIDLMFKEMRHLKFIQTIPRIEAVLSTCESELDAPLYYDLSYLAAVVHSTIPPRENAISALERLGFSASLSHAERGVVKTDAPSEVVWDIVRSWYFATGKTLPADGVTRAILEGGRSDIDVSVDEDVKERLRKERLICKFYNNPEKNFGPKAAAKPKH